MVLDGFARPVRAFKSYSRRKKIAIAAGASLVVLLVIPILTYAYFARDISDRERLMNRNNTGIRILDKEGEAFYTFGRIQGDEVGLDQISDHMEQAVIASEDKEFYEHPGYSLRGMAGALYGNILSKDVTRYGGSTVTQQLVRNTLLSSSKNFLRKYQELSMAIAVERNYTKEEILEMYLNSVYFGEGAFGIGSAAKAYFDKTPDELTVAESSLLVGLLPAPSSYSPISGDPAKAKEQQERVLDHMLAAGYIDSDEHAKALAARLEFKDAPAVENNIAQHFSQMVLAELKERYGEERIARSGFEVTSGLDLDWQRIAERQVKVRVSELSSQGGTNSGAVAIDPRSGQIRVLVGSVDWENKAFGKVNMAVASRQPGSSFKPIFFSEALERKIITPATILHDSPRTYGNYRPQNYDFRYMGDITTRRALALSRNLTAIEVIQKLGVENAAKAAQRMGISTVNQPERYGLSLGVGTAEVRLLDMANAYAAFANGGRQFEPISVVSIKDKFGKTIFTNRSKSKQVQSEEASFLVSSILSDKEARAPTFNSLNLFGGRTSAAKTGTTDNNRDAWTIGYTPSVSLGVWVGNNQNEPMSGVAGASGAGPIWRNTMNEILSGSEYETFDRPPGVVQVQVCTTNGPRAIGNEGGTYQEYFIRGTVPSRTCNEQPANNGRENNRGRGNREDKDDKKDKENKDDNGGDDNDNEEEEDPEEPAPPPAPGSPSPTPPGPTPPPPSP